MSSFEPISRAHAGFVDILHVGRTSDYLYYIMELADDHMAAEIARCSGIYVPRTLKSDLDRTTAFGVDSIKLGISLTEDSRRCSRTA